MQSIRQSRFHWRGWLPSRLSSRLRSFKQQTQAAGPNPVHPATATGRFTSSQSSFTHSPQLPQSSRFAHDPPSMIAPHTPKIAFTIGQQYRNATSPPGCVAEPVSGQKSIRRARQHPCILCRNALARDGCKLCGTDWCKRSYHWPRKRMYQCSMPRCAFCSPPHRASHQSQASIVRNPIEPAPPKTLPVTARSEPVPQRCQNLF